MLSFRGFDTPSLPAQGEQRLPLIFNIQRGNATFLDRTSYAFACRNFATSLARRGIFFRSIRLRVRARVRLRCMRLAAICAAISCGLFAILNTTAYFNIPNAVGNPLLIGHSGTFPSQATDCGQWCQCDQHPQPKLMFFPAMLPFRGNHLFNISGQGYTYFSSTKPLGGDAMADNPFEIPQALRDVSEQNLKQARAAYEQLVNFMIKAMGPWMAAMPSNPIADSFKDVQGRAMQIAMKMPSQLSRSPARSATHRLSKRS